MDWDCRKCVYNPVCELWSEAERQDAYGYLTGGIADDCPLFKTSADVAPVKEWISVKDRLPEENGEYITFACPAAPIMFLHNFDKDIGKFGAWWNYDPDGKKHPRYRFIEATSVTHWMPTPQPPKGE